MTDLVERSRAVRKAVYVEVGHINDWSAHDHMVADCADETATEIELLQEQLACALNDGFDTAKREFDKDRRELEAAIEVLQNQKRKDDAYIIEQDLEIGRLRAEFADLKRIRTAETEEIERLLDEKERGTTDFYIAIESGVRRLVFLLRNNGINTECSCHHEGFIQCQTVDPTSEIRTIKSILWEEKIEDYEIEIRHEGMNLSSCLVIRSPSFKQEIP